VTIGIQFLLWTAGGLYFIWSDMDEVHGDYRRRSTPLLTPDTTAWVSPSVVIANLREAGEQPDSILGYDWLTDWYDLAIKLTMPEQKIRNLLMEEVSLKKGEKVLELGFRTGQNLLLLKSRCPGANLRGLDIDPKARAIAQHKVTKQGMDIPLDLYDGGAFPYPDAQFDKVYSWLVFHQLDAATKLACLREIHRVLRSDGRLVIADWGQADGSWMRLAFGLVQLLDGFKTTNDNVRGRMPNFIREAGFQNLAVARSINTALGTFSYFTSNKT